MADFPTRNLDAVSMYMKDRKAFESDEAYLAYCWSLKSDDLSDEELQEYLERRIGLPGYDTGNDAAHLVVARTKESPLTTKAVNNEEEED